MMNECRRLCGLILLLDASASGQRLDHRGARWRRPRSPARCCPGPAAEVARRRRAARAVRAGQRAVVRHRGRAPGLRRVPRRHRAGSVSRSTTTGRCAAAVAGRPFVSPRVGRTGRRSSSTWPGACSASRAELEGSTDYDGLTYQRGVAFTRSGHLSLVNGTMCLFRSQDRVRGGGADHEHFGGHRRTRPCRQRASGRTGRTEDTDHPRRCRHPPGARGHAQWRHHRRPARRGSPSLRRWDGPLLRPFRPRTEPRRRCC